MTLDVGSLFTFIILLFVIGVIVWLAFWVLGQMGMPDPPARFIRIAIVIVATLIILGLLLNAVGVWPGAPIAVTK